MKCCKTDLVAHTHTHTHTDTHTHTLMCMHSCTHTLYEPHCTDPCMLTHTYTHMHAYTYAHTHTHMYTHTYTHTHTHTQNFIVISHLLLVTRKIRLSEVLFLTVIVVSAASFTRRVCCCHREYKHQPSSVQFISS